jgi:hypothetical protein
MAKSLRSKSKRSFRAKKRTEGIFAATEAARLHRLNSKIRAHISAPPPEDDTPPVEQKEELAAEEQTGPYWFELLGLLAHDELGAENLQALDTLVRVCERRDGMRRVVVVDLPDL